MANPPINESLRRIVENLQTPGRLVLPPPAYADPREQLLVRASEGEAVWNPRSKTLALEGPVTTAEGETDGHWSGIYQLSITFTEAAKVPAPAPPPYAVPEGPIPEAEPQAQSKGRWTFGDGSSLEVVGPALVHTVETSIGEIALWLSASQLITGGSRDYAGAEGTKTAGISIWLPKGEALGRKKATVRFKSVDVFRIAKKSVIGPLPKPPANAGAGK